MDAEETEMSNAPDDPGHRPPPPRQGDPLPYEQQPYPGGYAPPPPPPHHQPPHGGPWQQPPAGYGPPEVPGGYRPPETSAGYGRPGAGGKGLFGSLFDLSFDHMVTARMIRVVYILAILLISLTSLFMFLVGLWALQFNWGKYFGVFLVPAAPLLWLFELVTVRVVLEFVINQFKITEHLKALRERGELR